MRTSLLDPQQRNIDENRYIVGIFHKPKGENPQHAFLMVEGVDQGKTLFRRYDLFTDKKDDKKFEIHPQEKSAFPVLARKVLTTELLKNDGVKGKCWIVCRADAEQLQTNVLEQIRNPKRIYNILGDKASLPQTNEAICSDSITAVGDPGHNCFTWARQALHALEIPEIKRDLPISVLDITTAVPSLHLSDSTLQDVRSMCCIL